MRLRRYRPVTVLLLALHLQACMSWRPSVVSPEQVVEEGSFRVTMADGLRLEVRNATIEDDSLRADRLCRDIECPGGVAPRVTIALDDVQELETRRFNVVKTGLWLGALGLVYGIFTTETVGNYQGALGGG